MSLAIYYHSQPKWAKYGLFSLLVPNGQCHGCYVHIFLLSVVQTHYAPPASSQLRQQQP